jgi:glucosamine kinase
MILVCDSGSTKADWALIKGKKILSEFQTDGLNPVHMGEEVILQKLTGDKNISTAPADISQVHFFGAGCGSAEGKSTMTAVLKKIFPAGKVNVDNDLFAAAIATCGNDKGMIAILGTGSNCCFYDGTSVHPKNFGLGYILGDECSGAWFGKKFLRDFAYGLLPEKLHAEFFDAFKLNRSQIIEAVYRKPAPNLFLSSFMPFMATHRENGYIKKIFADGLAEFFDTNVSAFKESEDVPIHFVGSVASILGNEIREMASAKNFRTGKILKRPMDGLKDHFSAL